MLIALFGLIGSIIMIIVGFAVIGARGEMRGDTYTTQGTHIQVGTEDVFGEKRRGVHVFRGIQKGAAFYAEKSTAEILALLARGRLREAWPWALAALGTLLIFFWGPLMVGLLVGWERPGLWAFVGLFFLGALWAAFPRRRKDAGNSDETTDAE